MKPDCPTEDWGFVLVAKTAKAKAKLPITRHPLFPVMVGLWFAALFGLGSLAIRPTLLESVVIALKIDLVVPAAAPPLGLTARILLALAMFVLGGALGVILARQLGRNAPAPRTSARNPMAQARGPKFAAVADGEDFERLAAARREPPANAIPGRRRALAMEEDFSPDYHDIAPIPGGSPQILDLADLGPMEIEEDDAGFPAFAETPQPVAAPFAQLAPFAAPVEAPTMSDADAVVPPPLKPEQRPVPEASFDPWNRHAPSPVAEPEPELAESEAARPFAAPQTFQPQTFAPAPVAAETFVAPAPFAQPAAEPQTFEAAPQLQDVPQPVFAPEPAPQPQPEIAAAPAAPEPVEPLSTRLAQLSPDAEADLRAVAVDSLGVVQLAERLAMAISRRRAASEAPAVLAPAAPPVPQVIAPPPLPQPGTMAGPFADLAPSLENVPSPPAFAPAPAEPVAVAPFAPAMPASLRPMNFDEHDDEPLDMVLPPRSFAAVAAPAVADDAPVTGTEAEDDNFGSLLGMKTTLRQNFVRIEEPVEDFADIEPVVVFPGQGAQAPFANPAPFGMPTPAAAVVPEPVAAGHRFDIPPVPSAVPSARAVDPEETERALKSALATLQRMSGAA